MDLQANMLNFAYMLTSNRDDAYDLLQDTTLKALDNEDKYAENTNFKGWVFTIMRNIFINNYRRGVRTATIVDTTDNLYHLNLSQDSGIESPKAATAPPKLPPPSASFPTTTAFLSACMCRATNMPKSPSTWVFRWAR